MASELYILGLEAQFPVNELAMYQGGDCKLMDRKKYCDSEIRCNKPI